MNVAFTKRKKVQVTMTQKEASELRLSLGICRGRVAWELYLRLAMLRVAKGWRGR